MIHKLSSFMGHLVNTRGVFGKHSDFECKQVTRQRNLYETFWMQTCLLIEISILLHINCAVMNVTKLVLP